MLPKLEVHRIHKSLEHVETDKMEQWTTNRCEILVRTKACVDTEHATILAEDLRVKERIRLDEKTRPAELVFEPYCIWWSFAVQCTTFDKESASLERYRKIRIFKKSKTRDRARARKAVTKTRIWNGDDFHETKAIAK